MDPVGWYANQTPQVQAALQGFIVMLILALVKAALHYAGRPLGQDAISKLGKYLAVATMTAATTLVTTGATEQFWMQWLAALFAAVGAWEGLAKLYGLGALNVPDDEPISDTLKEAA